MALSPTQHKTSAAFGDVFPVRLLASSQSTLNKSVQCCLYCNVQHCSHYHE